jgi:uncharacterized protein DUF3540
MSTARKIEPSSFHLVSAVVERVSGRLEVRLGASSYPAKRAKSCLVLPDVGDHVLCAVESADLYVLAVLEGAAGAPTTIGAEGDLQIHAARGRIGLCADGIDLVGADDVSVNAGELDVRARAGTLAVAALDLFGEVLQANVAKVTALAETLDATAERISQRVKRAFRFVEEIDQTRAGSIDLRAEKVASVRAENALISARLLAKIDGEQINIG